MAEIKLPDIFPKDDGTNYPKLLAAAQTGDKKALSALAVHLDRHPEMWDRMGDMARRARAAWIEVATGKDALSAEAIRRRVATLRDELKGDDSSPLEKLLIDRVILCWIQVHHAEEQYAYLLQGSSTLQAGDYYQRRIDRAHYRYLAAIRTLAVVRKLLAPSIHVGPVTQMNVSNRAVNLVGPAPTTENSDKSVIMGAKELA